LKAVSEQLFNSG